MATKQKKISLNEAAIAARPLGTDEDPPIPAGGSRIYRFEGGTGLAVRVFGSGKKTFLYCYTSDELDKRSTRIERRISLGIEWTKGGGTLALAKDKTRELAGKPMESGRQKMQRLRAEQQESAKEITVGKLIDRYLTEYAKPKKRSWKADENRLDKHVRPVWGERKAKDITRADVDALVSPVAIGDPERGIPPRPAEANHRLAAVRKMFSFAVDKGIIEHHPCLRMSAPGGKLQARQRALTTAKELRLFWRITDRSGPWAKAKHEEWPRGLPWERRGRMNPTVADALRFVLATGCRANEATGLTWAELDLDAGEWVLPAARSKNKRAHLMPLLPDTVAMLRTRREAVAGDYVFPSQWFYTVKFPTKNYKPHINDKHLSEALGHACVRLAPLGLEPFYTHDLRRTVETGMAAAKVPKEYRDRVLNHVDASVGGVHYNVHDYKDEKREALEKWARRLESMLRPERDNVVPLRRASQ